MGIFAIFMPSGNFHSHEDLVRMDLSYRAFFRARIDANAIADLQHLLFLPWSNYAVLRRWPPNLISPLGRGELRDGHASAQGLVERKRRNHQLEGYADDQRR